MKLLIVDDEIELVSGLIRFLGRFGHNSATALPDGDGLDVIRTVVWRRSNPDNSGSFAECSESADHDI